MRSAERATRSGGDASLPRYRRRSSVQPRQRARTPRPAQRGSRHCGCAASTASKHAHHSGGEQVRLRARSRRRLAAAAHVQPRMQARAPLHEAPGHLARRTSSRRPSRRSRRSRQTRRRRRDLRNSRRSSSRSDGRHAHAEHPTPLTMAARTAREPSRATLHRQVHRHPSSERRSGGWRRAGRATGASSGWEWCFRGDRTRVLDLEHASPPARLRRLKRPDCCILLCLRVRVCVRDSTWRSVRARTSCCVACVASRAEHRRADPTRGQRNVWPLPPRALAFRRLLRCCRSVCTRHSAPHDGGLA